MDESTCAGLTISPFSPVTNDANQLDTYSVPEPGSRVPRSTMGKHRPALCPFGRCCRHRRRISLQPGICFLDALLAPCAGERHRLVGDLCLDHRCLAVGVEGTGYCDQDPVAGGGSRSPRPQGRDIHHDYRHVRPHCARPRTRALTPLGATADSFRDPLKTRVPGGAIAGTSCTRGQPDPVLNGVASFFSRVCRPRSSAPGPVRTSPRTGVPGSG